MAKPKKKSNLRTLNLKRWRDGNYGYTLPGKTVIETSHTTVSGVARMVTVAPRYTRDEEGKTLVDPKILAEQATYKFHYIALDDYYNSAPMQDVLDDGWTRKATLDVMTGKWELIPDA